MIVGFRLITVFALGSFGILLVTCNPPPVSGVSIEISMDIPCELTTSTAIPLSVRGQFPSDANITWKAIHGKIEPNTGVAVIYTGPAENTEDIITVSVESEEINRVETLYCNIVSPTATPTQENETPTPTPMDQVEQTRVVTETPPVDILPSIAITEVMGNPCGDGINYEQPYEYIELFNYGVESVDITGWWFTDHGNNKPGHPDRIIAWNQRHPFISLGGDLIENSTVLEPGQYALILAPLYPFGLLDPPPYEISSDTVILTIEDSDRLGDDETGILSSVAPIDVIALYIGTENRIDKVVSTYGSPSIENDNPLEVVNEGLREIPLVVTDCLSAHRVQVAGPDIESNWIEGSITPGSGD